MNSHKIQRKKKKRKYKLVYIRAKIDAIVSSLFDLLKIDPTFPDLRPSSPSLGSTFIADDSVSSLIARLNATIRDDNFALFGGFWQSHLCSVGASKHRPVKLALQNHREGERKELKIIIIMIIAPLIPEVNLNYKSLLAIQKFYREFL
jgi:hypothetical protein